MEVICDSCCMPIENHAGNFKWNGEPICEGCHEAGCGEFQCPDCDAVVDYTLHQKGKTECCKFCVDCEEHKKPGEGWSYDEDGDHCEECTEAAKQDNGYCPICNALTNTKCWCASRSCCKCLEITFCGDCGKDCEDMDCSHDWESHWVCSSCDTAKESQGSE